MAPCSSSAVLCQLLQAHAFAGRSIRLELPGEVEALRVPLPSCPRASPTTWSAFLGNSEVFPSRHRPRRHGSSFFLSKALSAGMKAASSMGLGSEDPRVEDMRAIDRFRLATVPHEIFLRPSPGEPPPMKLKAPGTPADDVPAEDPPYPVGGIPFAAYPERDAGPPGALRDAAHQWTRHLAMSSSKAVEEARHLQQLAQAARDVADQAATQVEYMMNQPCLRRAFSATSGWEQDTLLKRETSVLDAGKGFLDLATGGSLTKANSAVTSQASAVSSQANLAKAGATTQLTAGANAQVNAASAKAVGAVLA